MAQTSGIFPELSDNVKKSVRRSLPSKRKAREILHDGTVHGKPLTKKQRGLFGILASGQRPSRIAAPRGTHTRRARARARAHSH